LLLLFSDCSLFNEALSEDEAGRSEAALRFYSEGIAVADRASGIHVTGCDAEALSKLSSTREKLAATREYARGRVSDLVAGNSSHGSMVAAPIGKWIPRVILPC